MILFQRAGGATGTSFSIDIGAAGNDRLVIVFANNEDQGAGFSAVSVDGKAMTQYLNVINTLGSGNQGEMWAIHEDQLGASNGTVTVAATGGDADWAMHAHVYTGVKQQAPKATFSQNTGDNTDTSTVTGVNAAVDELVAMMSGGGNPGTSTWSAPLIERYDENYPVSAGYASASAILTTALVDASLTTTFSQTMLRTVGLVGVWEPAPGGVDVAVPSKAFSLTGQVPGVSTGINITAPVKNFLKTGQVPVIGTGANVNAPVGAFTLSGHVPAFQNSINVQAPVKAYSLTGQVPGVGTGVDIASPGKAFTLSPNVPVISAGATTIRPPAKAYALTGHAPTVAIGVNIFAPAKAFVLTALVPVIGVIQAVLRRLAFVARDLRTAFVPKPVDETGVRTAVADPESRLASVPRENRSAKV